MCLHQLRNQDPLVIVSSQMRTINVAQRWRIREIIRISSFERKVNSFGIR